MEVKGNTVSCRLGGNPPLTYADPSVAAWATGSAGLVAGGLTATFDDFVVQAR